MLPPYLQDVVSGIAGGAGFVTVLGFILKIFPKTWGKLATSLFANVDFGKLPYESDANRLVHEVHADTERLKEQAAHVDERLDEISRQSRSQFEELTKDTVKNTIMQLMRSTDDESDNIRYELEKLRKYDAECWVVERAEAYLATHKYGDLK